MEGFSRMDEVRPQLLEGFSRMDEVRPQLLGLIPNWPNEEKSSEEKQLELRLGPPGEDWTIKNGSIISTCKKNNSSDRERDESSLLSLGYFSSSGSKRGFLDTIVADRKTVDQPNTWINGSHTHKLSSAMNTQVVGAATVLPSSSSSPWLSSRYQQSLPPVMEKESLQQQQQEACGTAKLVVDLQNSAKKAFSPGSANNTAVPNSYQKRTAPAPVVGWPPIRSFRKNLASSSSSRLPAEAQNVVPRKNASEKQVEKSCKGLFVKINMDGVPIGRKVDLKAYESYEKLSCAVDELFRGLLAAQRDPSAGRIPNNQEGEKAITGILDGSGEYTLVYEDNEGDRMLVGDVPWHMFVSTVKRLRLLKSSGLSSSLFVGSKQEKNPLNAAAALKNDGE